MDGGDKNSPVWPCCSLSFSMSQYPIYHHTHIHTSGSNVPDTENFHTLMHRATLIYLTIISKTFQCISHLLQLLLTEGKLFITIHIKQNINTRTAMHESYCWFRRNNLFLISFPTSKRLKVYYFTSAILPLRCQQSGTDNKSQRQCSASHILKTATCPKERAYVSFANQSHCNRLHFQLSRTILIAPLSHSTRLLSQPEFTCRRENLTIDSIALCSG